MEMKAADFDLPELEDWSPEHPNNKPSIFYNYYDYIPQYYYSNSGAAATYTTSSGSNIYYTTFSYNG